MQDIYIKYILMHNIYIYSTVKTVILWNIMTH